MYIRKWKRSRIRVVVVLAVAVAVLVVARQGWYRGVKSVKDGVEKEEGWSVVVYSG